MRFISAKAIVVAVLALFCVSVRPVRSQPTLSFVSPQGMVEQGAGVVLVAEYDAPGVGVDPSTFTASLDGFQVEYTCYARDTRVECTPWSPAPGAHRLVISIADLAGKRTEANLIFEIHAANADTDVHEPLLSVARPSVGDVFRDATVEVDIGYQDDLSGIDLGTLSLRLDGIDILDRCSTPNGSGLVCTLADMPPGDYLLQAWIADLAGNLATKEVLFSRLEIPAGDMESPTAEMRPPDSSTHDRQPSLVLVFSDSESGVDAASVVITVDGTDLTERCHVSSVYAWCPTISLAPARHWLGVDLSDRAGNATTIEFDFEVDPNPSQDPFQ